MNNLTLKQYRKMLKLSQQDFADKLGYTQAHISTLESSRRNLTDEFLEKLNKVFGVTKKGYTIISNVDNYTNNSNNINNKGVENSTISNQIGSSYSNSKIENELVKLQIELEASKKIIKLQDELIAQLKLNKK